ncbi:MAG: efflux RND transporter permease subunit [Gloeocapsa sp. DLM2.Bin57]|nr:MAG: efflux RND transporter permease subunit [Gloeocapsa sp. DLM2.Bin57]
MSFHLSTWSIKNPIPTILLFIILSIVGISSFLGLGIDSSPNIDIPIVTVTVSQRGASPSELETQVTKKIEDAVAGLGNIDQIISTVNDGSSTTVINFLLGTDTNQATNDVRNSIAQIRQELPLDINEPIVRRLEFSGGAILTYAVASDKLSVEELSDFVDNRIIRELLNVEGVAAIDRIGGVDREIRVDLAPDRLQAYQITATEVNDQIRNVNINLAGGRTQIGTGEQNVRTLGSAETVEELGNYPIILPNGDTVALGNLGNVTDGFAEIRQSAFLNNQPVIGFSVRRSTGTNLVTVEQGVKKAIAELETTLPEDLNFKLIFTLGNSIRASYQSTIGSLIIGCILTVITVGIFLRDWRITLITALALPLSIVPTFLVMQALNYTLNGMTLLALALAVGNLVDDAICMIENIEQHLQMGKTPYQAALDGAREIGLAVVATTATIVAVFLPVAFMGGIPGQFFKPFGVTVAVSTMFSTLVATTMTPMLSAYLLKNKPYSSATNQTFRPYRNILSWALRHRLTTLIIAIAFFIASLQLVPYIPKGLIDSSDNSLSILSLELPPGAQLSQTEALTAQVSNLLQEQPEVVSTLSTIGSESQGNSSTIYVNLVPKRERNISQLEFQQRLRGELSLIPGARSSFRALGGAGNSKDLSIILKSENPTLLTATAAQLEQEISQIPGIVELVSSASLVKPEIIIQPNFQRAADLGVSVQAIARTASLALLGDNEANLAKFNLSDRQIPIRVKIDPDYHDDLETIRNLSLPSSRGTLVPLNAVADIRLGSGPATINRFNRYRQVTLEANLQDLSLGEAMAKIRNLPAFNPLPPGVTEEPAGDAKIMQDIFTGFASALGLAVLSIYAILVLLYNNFLYPLAILTALPLSVGGSLLALLVMQKELGLFALIGIVLLMGLVTKNAILLVDFILAALSEGKPLSQAIINAGVSRLRPILMTSISTIAGMIPIALELGADGAVRSPMAIAVIGGFTTSTLLTLVVVPVFFTYIYNLGKKAQKLFQH